MWIYKILGGRHTTFAWWFALTAFLLAWRHELTHTYVEIIVALQAYVLAHSYKEDHKPDRQGDAHEG